MGHAALRLIAWSTVGVTSHSVHVRADVVPVNDKEELPGLVRTRRVVITPLRVILHPPQLEETNRILRQCAPLPHHALQFGSS